MYRALHRLLLVRQHRFIAAAPFLNQVRRNGRVEVRRRLAEHLAVYDRLVSVDRLALGDGRKATKRRDCAKGKLILGPYRHSPSYIDNLQDIAR